MLFGLGRKKGKKEYQKREERKEKERMRWQEHKTPRKFEKYHHRGDSEPYNLTDSECATIITGGVQATSLRSKSDKQEELEWKEREGELIAAVSADTTMEPDARGPLPSTSNASHLTQTPCAESASPYPPYNQSFADSGLLYIDSDSGTSSRYAKLDCEEQEEESEMAQKHLERRVNKRVGIRVFKRSHSQSADGESGANDTDTDNERYGDTVDASVRRLRRRILIPADSHTHAPMPRSDDCNIAVVDELQFHAQRPVQRQRRMLSLATGIPETSVSFGGQNTALNMPQDDSAMDTTTDSDSDRTPLDNMSAAQGLLERWFSASATARLTRPVDD
jgi:hypothetical protein